MAQSVVSFLKGLLIQKEDDRSKQLQIEVDASATASTKTTLQAAQTANRTIVLPDASTELLGDDASQIVTNKTIDADNNTITNIENADIKALAAIDATKIADGSVSNTEFQYISTVTSNVQDQLDSNADAINDHITDTTDAHDASAISNVPSGNLVATDVQGALDELQSDVDTRATTASNVGTGDGNVFKQKTGSTLELKTIKAGTNITITDNADDITIDASGGGGGANTTLSNLTSPTSINQNLIPSIDITRTLGSNGAQWLELNSLRTINTRVGGATILQSGTLDGFYAGAPTSSGISSLSTLDTVPLYLETAPNTSADAVATNDIIIRSGNKTAGTGDSGDVQLQIGTSSGGTRGKIKFTDGTEGTSGHIWTSSGTSGEGRWQTKGAYQISSSSGSYSTSSASYTDVTNLSVSITTNGRPVIAVLTADSSGGFININEAAGTDIDGDLKILRDASDIFNINISSSATGATAISNSWAPGSFLAFDTPAAGTYTYKVQVRLNTGDNFNLNDIRLTVYEI